MTNRSDAGRRRRALSLVAVVASVLGGLAYAAPAVALGGDTVTDPAYDFVAKVDVGSGSSARGCTGALVAPQWIITARDCFSATGQVALGAPATATTVTVGRGGAGVAVVHLVPHPDRNVVLAQLATPVTGVPPVRLATTVPAAGDTVTAAGFGRTGSVWVPGALHAASFGVDSVQPAALTITGRTAGAVLCRGDGGGPAVRGTATGLELVALHDRSWQGGCLGETETRRAAVETRLDDLAGWIRAGTADVTVFGALADGRLTASTIDEASGDRQATVTSAASIGFTPKALATLNATTLLVTSPDGVLYRVDVTATNPALTFAAPVRLGTGWTHDLLSFDGDGSLFGIADGVLRRYTVTTAKPTAASITAFTTVGSGFSLKTMTATGPDWIVGTTSAGALISYHIDRAGAWTRAELASSGWGAYTHLVSPGAGLYYARTTAGGLSRFRDAAPFDGKGTDIQSFPADPVDTAGWNQLLLSAQPRRSYPQSPADVSVFGVAADGRLTYTAVDSATGDRVATVTSTGALGFTPRALATLNFDTVLVTSTANRLYRVDVLSTVPSLTFAAPVDLGSGWSHDLLTYDGDGHLFGIADGVLRRYTITSAKPAATNLTEFTTIDSGFSLKTLTTTGPDWILGTTSAGALISYHIEGKAAWTRASLATTGWGAYTHLVSPGAGLYYARTTAGGLNRFRDAAPFDGKGTDIQSFPADPVDAGGWDQLLLSAQPFNA